MTHIDLFSGIGGGALAARSADFTTRLFCEIEKFPRRVLAARFSGLPIHDDITTLTADLVRGAYGISGPIGLLTAGWPCQDVSVAGKRAGLAGARSGLFFHLCRLVDELRPRWLLLENVPGLVSSGQGRDFAVVVHELRRRGYVGCVRRLDAQHFGLAQRRCRLFFVAGPGDAGRRAVQSLLEGGARHPAPRRETGEDVDGTLGGGSGERGWANDTDRMTFIPYRQRGFGDYTADLRADARKSRDDHDATDLIVSAPLMASGACTGRPAGMANEAGYLVAHALTGEGFEASEDGTGRGTPLVAFPEATPIQADAFGRSGDASDGVKNPGLGDAETGAPMFTLDSSRPHAVALRMREGCEGGGKGPLLSDELSLAQARGNDQVLAIQEAQTGTRLYESIGTQRADAPGSQPCGSLVFGMATSVTPKFAAELSPPLMQPSPSGGGQPAAACIGSSVRRLTPTECERLQGFSWRDPVTGEWQDGWTCLCGKNHGRSYAEDGNACTCPDGPRYRALGNAWAVPCAIRVARCIKEAEEAA